ncbi:MAG TPA: DUF4321 domain-containing protein [Dictyoglomaceae bacterium]|nr:DUF4321 domain-containing protein [Dictyoglomaceae bacterium]HOL38720.1 DUF4321 domain-containing protein [Dictyoglomaceae bacterium]HOP94576.1 DUF4321 domain-containing protein [Dictyoglomaceae bacterium]HPP15531.1 DUF4321 domain-containing protein [Dictyoglomaceae bacterium]HPU42846.1 DUF4321 domain-containing protein [Dictyoglomaceae bacterium]
MRRSRMSTRLFIFLIVLGMIIGGVVAEALGDRLEILRDGIFIGFSPFTVDLYFVTFTFGFDLRINLGSVIGILVVLLFYSI